MIAPSSRGKRLLRRYPLLAPVPEDERPAVVRAALRHPVILLLLIGGALLLLPLYFEFVIAFFAIAEERDNILMLAKLGVAVLLPAGLIVPLFSRLLLPFFIRREMERRGYF